MATLFNEDDLKNIVMECENEIEYKDPSDMIDENGKKNYAYVTLVMLGDLYVSAAIVLAHSLKKLNTNADLVVLVTPDVSETAKRVLGMYFDKVKEINYITVPNWRTKKQTHRKYLELVFTKFHLFNLTEYKKVILIDADAIVLKYPDHIFNLNAPAGCLLEDKELFISYDSEGNYILPSDGKIKWYEIYCKCCPHGSLIPKEITDRIYKNFRNSGIGGGLMLLEPKEGELESILKDVGQGKMKYLLENKLIWPEQQYLTLRYSGKWHNINPRFFGLQGYPHWSVLYGLQYGGDKPFVLNSKLPMSMRIEFPDFILWHQYYGEILKEHPELKDNISLNEANEMHKYFKTKLHRHQILSKNDINYLLNKISHKYDIPKHKINTDHVKYYYLDDDTIYRPVNDILPMFTKIEEYDYIEPIKRLAEYFSKSENKYYQNLYDSYKIPLLRKNLDLYDNIDPIDRDEIMLQYVKCRQNTFIITIWSIAMPKFNEIIKYLEELGNIYYTKIVNLSKNGIRNLMYWMYDEFKISHKLDFIEKKLDYTNTQNYNNQVGFIIFDNVKDLKLSGQGSKSKTDIRNKILELIGADRTQIRGNDVAHINDYFYQTIEYSQIILNNNSINLLENQDVRRYNHPKMKSTNLNIQTLRKWIFKNLSQLEILRMLVIGGLILYSYGVRKSNDIDGLMIGNQSNVIEKDLVELIDINLNNKKTKFFFLDFGLIGSKHWKDTWSEQNKLIFNVLQIANEDEVVFNPRYHMYFNGLKLYTINFEIVKKVLRHRPGDYADFIMMYFFHRHLLGRYVYLNKDNKMQFLDDFKITPDKKNDYFVNFIHDVINKRYIKEEAEKITKNIIEKLFY